MSEKNNDMPRLVKKIFIYSNGDTIERMYTGVPKKSPLVSVIARLDSNVVREFSSHYQIFLRVEKPANGDLLGEEIFQAAACTLSKMLLLKRKSSVKNSANESECD
jgi:hypothetical protein